MLNRETSSKLDCCQSGRQEDGGHVRGAAVLRLAEAESTCYANRFSFCRMQNCRRTVTPRPLFCFLHYHKKHLNNIRQNFRDEEGDHFSKDRRKRALQQPFSWKSGYIEYLVFTNSLLKVDKANIQFKWIFHIVMCGNIDGSFVFVYTPWHLKEAGSRKSLWWPRLS